MPARKFWFLGTLTVAAALLYVSLRGIDWRVVGHTIRSISFSYAGLAVALGLVPMLLRAARWRILLQAEAPVAYSTAFWAVAAGYFGNNFLPARGGELVRSYIVRARSHLAVSYVLATALSERVADAVALVIFGAVALAFMPRAETGMKLMRGSFAVIGALECLDSRFCPGSRSPWTECCNDGRVCKTPPGKCYQVFAAFTTAGGC